MLYMGHFSCARRDTWVGSTKWSSQLELSWTPAENFGRESERIQNVPVLPNLHISKHISTLTSCYTTHWGILRERILSCKGLKHDSHFQDLRLGQLFAREFGSTWCLRRSGFIRHMCEKIWLYKTCAQASKTYASFLVKKIFSFYRGPKLIKVKWKFHQGSTDGMQKFTGKMPTEPRTRTHNLWEPVQAIEQHFARATWHGNFK